MATWARGVLALAGLILLGLAGLALAPSGSPGAASAPAPALGARAESGPELVVDPTSWWMPAGNSTNLSATWVGASPGCSIGSLWFRWSILAGPAEGELLGTFGPNVTFAATSSVTGDSLLAVRSAAVQECGRTNSTTVASAFANMSVVAPITVANISIQPNPILPGDVASLGGWVAGGEPPYAVRVQWGDGSSSLVTVLRAGDFAVAHAFAAGTYRPSITVNDAVGDVASASVGGPLEANDSLSVAITPDSWAVDVGIPAEFSAGVLGAPNGSGSGWMCSTPAAAMPRALSASTNFSCAFSAAGVGEVLYEVFPPVPGATASAEWTEVVEPLPTVVPVAGTPAAEVGQPCVVGFETAGGVPPFRLDWAERGTSVTGSLTSPTDGRLYVPFVPQNSGALSIEAWLVDADGSTSANATVQLQVQPVLNASATLLGSIAGGQPELEVAGSVLGGTPPFEWAVVPAIAPATASSPGGTIASPGAFAWQGAFDDEGNVSVTVTIVDAAGADYGTELSAAPVAALGLEVTVSAPNPRAAGNASLEVSISGGLPPFTIRLNASGTADEIRIFPLDAQFTWPLDFGRGGTFSIRLELTDALGVARNFTGAVSAYPPPTSSLAPAEGAANSGATVAAVVGALVAVGGGFLFLRGRRRKAPRVPTPTVDPLAVLRSIVEPADGAERPTVELLADEAGLPLDEAHAAIDRLIADGTLRVEVDADGTELLSWAGRGP